MQAHATKPASIAQRPAPAPGESLSSTFGPLDGALGHVHALFESREGDVWARMYQHLALFPANGEPPRMWRRNYGLLEAEWCRLTALGQDRDGNLWVSTDDVGVLRLAHGGSVTCYRMERSGMR